MDRSFNLDRLITFLKAEHTQYASLQIPSSIKEKQQMLRALMNIWMPHALPGEILKIQDDELQLQQQEKGIVEIDCAQRLQVIRCDITRLKVDAIVNAANSQMLGCFRPLHSCIDNAIHSAAGLQLRLECNEKMQQLGREAETSEVIITKGYNLPTSYVLHVVGPIIPDGVPTPGQEVQLANCYHNCLQMADAKGLESIAFCCIATGVFMFPQQRAAEIAVSIVENYLSTHQSSIKNIVFNVFTDQDESIYQSLLKL